MAEVHPREAGLAAMIEAALSAAGTSLPGVEGLALF